MMDEIAKIMGNLVHAAQTGKVEKVKEVTPRPEEGKNMPSPFHEVALRTGQDKEKRDVKTRKIIPSKNVSRIRKKLEKDEKKRLIDVIV
ncbi:MAG: hypothetical protein HZB80_03485 [Deltaproteobacteria bacterium]|nr:hypothetical protein [Deltaproteobacteria bacterium]